MKQLNTGKAEILLVKVWEGSTDIHVIGRILHFKNESASGEKIGRFLGLPDWNWKLLGGAWELTEEQWKEILPCELIGTVEPYNMQWLYPDYERSNIDGFETAVESGHSLLRANKIYSVNPYGKERPSIFNSVYNASQWQKAEDNTGCWVVLVKVKE